MADSFNILLGSKIDTSRKTINQLNNQIKYLSKNLAALQLKIDTKEIQNLSNQVKKIIKSISTKPKQLTVFDEKQLQEAGVKFTKITGQMVNAMEHVRKQYSDLGQAAIKGIQIDPLTKNIETFTVSVQESDGVIKNFKHSLIKLQNGQKAFKIDSITGVDKSVEAQAKRSRESIANAHAEAIAMNKRYDQEVPKAKQLKETLDQTVGTLRVQNETVQQARNTQLGFFEQLKVAIQSVSISLSSTTLYFQSMRFGPQLIQDISEVNSSMIELERVSDATQKELDNFRLNSPAIDNSLGVFNEEVQTTASEIVRLGYSLQETEELMKLSSASKTVGDLKNIGDATDGLISTMEVLKAEVSDVNGIIDYLGHLTITPTANMAGWLLGISLLIQGIAFLVRKNKELKEEQDRLFESYGVNVSDINNNISSLNKIGKEFDTLNEKLGRNRDFTKLTTEEQQKYNQVVEELKRISPEIIQGYDDKGNAIINYTTKIEDLITKEQKLLDLEKGRLLTSGGEIIETSNKEISDLKNEASEIQRNIDLTNNLIKCKQDILQKDYLSQESRSSHLEDLFKLKGQLAEYQSQHEDLNHQIDEQLQKQSKVYDVNFEFFNKFDNIPEKLKDVAKSFLEAESATNDFYSTVGKSKQFEAIFEDLNKFINSTSIGMAQSLEENIVKKFEELGFSAKEAHTFINLFINNLNKIEDVSDSIGNTSLSVSELADKLENASDNYDLLAKAQKELNETNNLSVDTMLEMIEKYEDFATAQDFTKQGILDFIKVKKDESTEFIRTEIDKTAKLIDETKKRIQAYQAEIKAIYTLQSFETDEDEMTSLQRLSHLANKVNAANKLIDEQTNKLNFLNSSYKSLNADFDKAVKPKDKKEFSETLDLIKTKIQGINQELEVLKQQLDDAITANGKQSILDKMIDAQNRKADILKTAIAEYQKQLNSEMSKLSLKLQQQVIQGDFSVVNIKDEKVSKTIKSVQDLQNTINGLNNDLAGVDNTIRSLADSISRIQIDELFKTSSKGIETLNKQFELLDFRMKLLDENEIGQKFDLMSEKIQKAEFQVRFLADELQRLKAIGFQGSAEAVEEYNNQLDDLEKKHRDAQLFLKSLNDDYKNEQKKVADEVIEAIKDGYRKEQELAIGAKEQKIKLAEEEYKRKVQLLDDWLAHHNRVIDDMLTDMDRLNAKEDYEDKLKELTDEKINIEKQLQIAVGLSDSAVDKDARIQEAQNKLVELDKEIEETMKERARTLRRDELLEIKKQNEAIVDDKKKSEDAKLNKVQQSAEEEIRLIQEKYDRLINNDMLYESIREDIMKGTYDKANLHITNILDRLYQYNAGTVREMGKSWQELGNTINRVMNAHQSMKNINNVNQNNQSNSNGDQEIDKQIIGMYQRIYSDFVNSNPINIVEKEQQKGGHLWDLNQKAEKIRAKYGWEYENYEHLSAPKYKDGGVVDFTGIANVHGSQTNSEVIFNSSQAKKLYDYVVKLPNIAANMDISKFIPDMHFLRNITTSQQQVATAGNAVWNINMNVDKIVGNKEGGKEMFKQLLKEVRNRGGVL